MLKLSFGWVSKHRYIAQGVYSSIAQMNHSCPTSKKFFLISFQWVRTKDLKGDHLKNSGPTLKRTPGSCRPLIPRTGLRPYPTVRPYHAKNMITKLGLECSRCEWMVFVHYLDPSWSRETSIAGVDSLGSNVGLTWQFGKPARVLGKNLLCRDWGLGESRARGHADSWVRYGLLLNWGGLDSVLSAVEPVTGFYYRYFFTPPHPLNYNFSLNLLVNNAKMTLNLWRIHDVLL
jgi:hypothetical protein